MKKRRRVRRYSIKHPCKSKGPRPRFASKHRIVNPRMQNMFVLIARHVSRQGQLLKYVGGVRFSTKGRAVLFPSRAAANMAARDLRSRFPILKRYTLSVQS